MKKKLAVVGRGTAGCFAAAHFLKWTDWEIDWYYDPNIKTQSAGEGLTPQVCKTLYENIGFEHFDLDRVDGSLKFSIFKKNWSTKTFHHAFATPTIAWHVNAVKLQNYILDKLRVDPRINTIEQNINHDQIDSDFIFDCSGFPEDTSSIELIDNIPVNSVYVTQCYWDYAKFNYTITEARSHGWFFGVPLKNRCSIGYMYNNEYSTVEQIKQDSNNIFNEYGLIPSEETFMFPFKSFFRKKNFDGRVAYNGNASFFLEPLEATTINTTDYIQRIAWDYWFENICEEEANQRYHLRINENENLIMMHYFAGSIFENNFWKMAQENGSKCMRKAIQSPVFYDRAFKEYKLPKTAKYDLWTAHSLDVNFEGLELYEKFRTLV